MVAPADVVERAQTLNLNGFHGYQPPGIGISKEYFMIAWCADLSEMDMELLRTESHCSSLEHGDFIGRGYLKIRWGDYSKINSVFNTMLKHRHWFITGNNAKVRFSPQTDSQFTDEKMEQKAIQGLRRLIDECPNLIKGENTVVHESFTEPWNYITKEGKQFCATLRQLKRLPPIDETHPDNYFNWDIFQNYDPMTLKAL